MTQPELDDLPPLVDALQRKINAQARQIEDLEDTLEATRGRVAHLEEIINPDPNTTTYEELTKSQKVYQVRENLVEEAAEGRGVATLEYKEVKWLFDGQPSVGHCYELMELAGELDGFNYEERDEADNRVTVKLDSVNDDTLVHAANKAVEA